MEINITYKSPEHEAAFLSELQRIPHIVNPESGRINPYWGASLYLLSGLSRWPELRIAIIGDDYMAFTAAKEAFNLSQNERIVVEFPHSTSITVVSRFATSFPSLLLITGTAILSMLCGPPLLY